MKDKADFDVKRKPEQPSTKKLIPVAVPPDTHTHRNKLLCIDWIIHVSAIPRRETIT